MRSWHKSGGGKAICGGTIVPRQGMVVAGLLPSRSRTRGEGRAEVNPLRRRFTGKICSWYAGGRIPKVDNLQDEGLLARMPMLGPCLALQAQTNIKFMRRYVRMENGDCLLPFLAVDRRWEEYARPFSGR